VADGFLPDKARRRAFRLYGPLTWESRTIGISHTLHTRCRPITEDGDTPAASEPARSAPHTPPSRNSAARMVPPPMPPVPEEPRRPRRRLRRKQPVVHDCIFEVECARCPNHAVDAHLSHDQTRDRG
jgi:hypothetical protein